MTTLKCLSCGNEIEKEAFAAQCPKKFCWGTMVKKEDYERAKKDLRDELSRAY